MNEGDTNQLMDDDIRQDNLRKKGKKGEDADSGNSEKDEEEADEEEADEEEADEEEKKGECYTDDGTDKKSQDEDCGDTSELNLNVKSSERKLVKGLDNEQPDDTDTRVYIQQKKDTARVRDQSDGKHKDLDTSDQNCSKGKNEDKEVPRVEGLRVRRSNNRQKTAHLGEGDTGGHFETKRSPVEDVRFRYLRYLPAILFLLVLAVVLWFLRTESPPSQKEFNVLEMFCQEMDKVQVNFPSQHRELWRRSRIHLQKHLNLTDPTEPVSLILTSGRGAQRTLGCLAQHLAAAFSKALNSSVLGIDGTSKSAQDSDQVKLDIDKALKEAFKGGTKAAVIHRFEALPPGSTLIFYRYCDHENAAFKKVFLAFTVMLQEEEEFPPNVSLGMVEEAVQEYLQEKFVSSDRTAKFNQMDLDKLSGLWSRISHLILPVAAEQKIEQYGCQT